MYISKILYEEFKKLRNEKKVISENLNKIDRKYFLLIKRNFFCEDNFDSLDKHKKLFFKDESDFENQKFIFEELDDFYKYRQFIIFSSVILFTKKLLFKNTSLIKDFNTKFLINSILFSPKKFIGKSLFLITSSLVLFRFSNKYFEHEISRKITLDSRLGIYLWFETNFRKGFLNYETFNYLDDKISRKNYIINKDESNAINERIFDDIIFYYLLKSHFYNFYFSKIFLNIIVPLLNNEKTSQFQLAKFLIKINQQFFEKLQKDRNYSFDNLHQEEVNIKTLNSFDFIKNSFKNNFEFEDNLTKTKGGDKLYLNEDNILHLIRSNELQQIFLNEFTIENLKNAYIQYKNGSI